MNNYNKIILWMRKMLIFIILWYKCEGEHGIGGFYNLLYYNTNVNVTNVLEDICCHFIPKTV
jgi:hypothetical protein